MPAQYKFYMYLTAVLNEINASYTSICPKFSIKNPCTFNRLRMNEIKRYGCCDSEAASDNRVYNLEVAG